MSLNLYFLHMYLFGVDLLEAAYTYAYDQLSIDEWVS